MARVARQRETEPAAATGRRVADNVAAGDLWLTTTEGTPDSYFADPDDIGTVLVESGRRLRIRWDARPVDLRGFGVTA